MECRPEKITSSVLDEHVDIYLVIPVPTSPLMTYGYVPLARTPLESNNQLFVIFTCVGLAAQPKKKNWFCRHCYS